MTSFKYFVIFAEMRTGSNFLEASLNEFDDLTVYGEAYNPHFVGHHNKTELFGIDLPARERDPITLIDKMIEDTDGVPGFRFFNDHDPRVMAHVLADPTCAKIVLTRNPLDSYVSLKIAGQTGQWKLSDVKQRRAATVTYDDCEFREHLAAKQYFQVDILNGLQTSGQTAFYIAYEDIQDVRVINGLAKWLGSRSEITATSNSTKRQNPSGLEEKVNNYDEMREQLSSLDHFGLSRTPNFEPRRGPGVPGFVIAKGAPLLFIPLRGARKESIVEWLDGLGTGGTETGLTQKELRQWKRQNRDHRSFAVLRHPLARAHAVFCKHIVPKSNDNYAEVRKVLRNRYGVAVPNPNEMDQYTKLEHRSAFANFLTFLKGNLAEQTSIRIDAAWATQSALLEGACGVAIPDIMIREAELEHQLSFLSERYGLQHVEVPAEAYDKPFTLSEVYDADLEKLCFAAYRKDYINFGFEDWASQAA